MMITALLGLSILSLSGGFDFADCGLIQIALPKRRIELSV
jgi:hypothetical protein